VDAKLRRLVSSQGPRTSSSRPGRSPNRTARRRPARRTSPRIPEHGNSPETRSTPVSRSGLPRPAPVQGRGQRPRGPGNKGKSRLSSSWCSFRVRRCRLSNERGFYWSWGSERQGDKSRVSRVGVSACGRGGQGVRVPAKPASAALSNSAPPAAVATISCHAAKSKPLFSQTGRESRRAVQILAPHVHKGPESSHDDDFAPVVTN